MSQFGTNTYRTVTVLESQAMATADGRVSIRLRLQEESIAFVVDQKAIDALRRDLLAAESFLRQSSERKPS